MEKDDPYLKEYLRSFEEKAGPFTPLISTINISRPVYSVNPKPKFSLDATISEILDSAVLIEPNFGHLEFHQDSDQLHIIQISNNQLKSLSLASDMAMQILHNSNLIVGLRLSRLDLSKESADLFYPLLFQCGRLNYLIDLDLSYNQLTPVSLNSLWTLLNPKKSGICPIKRIILTRCKLIPDEMIDFFTSIEENIILEELMLNGNSIQSRGMEALCRVLTSPENRLQNIVLGYSELTTSSIRELSTSIRSHPSLRRLQIQGNDIRDQGLFALLDAFEKGDSKETSKEGINEKESTIEELNVSCCGLSSARDWADPLSLCTALSTLDLSYNSIDDEGFRSLCQGLQNNCSLRHVDLSHNHFGGPTCGTIFDLLRTNKSLVDLSLAGNPLHLRVWEALRMGLEENNTLLTLDLSSCDVDLLISKIIARSFLKNDTVTLLLRDNLLPESLRNDIREYFRVGSGREELLPSSLLSAAQSPPPPSSSSSSSPSSSTPNLPFGSVNLLPLRLDVTTRVFENGSLWVEQRRIEINEAKRAKRGPVLPSLPFPSTSTSTTSEKASAKMQPTKIAISSNHKTEKLYSLTISYGRESEVLGDVLIAASTTYLDLRQLIDPLVVRYYKDSTVGEEEGRGGEGSKETEKKSRRAQVQSHKSYLNYTILDPNGRSIPPQEALIRPVLPELAPTHPQLTIRPWDWVSLSPAIGEDEY